MWKLRHSPLKPIASSRPPVSGGHIAGDHLLFPAGPAFRGLGGVQILLVRSAPGDRFVVTDRGQIASRLAMMNLDLTKPSLARSWARIRNQLRPSPMAGISDFEIAEAAPRDHLGDSIQHVAAAALQAEGLSALAPVLRRRARFSERVMRQANEHRLTVHPHDRLPNRFGARRQVSFSAAGAHQKRYVMALDAVQGTAFTDAHDRAKLAFTDASVDPRLLVTVIAQDAKPLSWHLESLRDNSTVIFEGEAADYWESAPKSYPWSWVTSNAWRRPAGRTNCSCGPWRPWGPDSGRRPASRCATWM